MQLARKPIANTGLEVSAIGLGTVKLGRDQGVKYPHQFQIPNNQEAARLISLAKDFGINLLDTAPAYGNSEQRLGELFRRELKGQRSEWIICSKVGEEFENGESRFDFSPEHIRYSIQRSLQRLGTDYIDMVLVHSDGNDLQVIEEYGVLQVLAELKQEGLIRATGMSTKTVAGGLKVLEQSDCAMVTYNLNHQEEEPVIDFALANNRAILVKKALASGHICHHETPHTDPVQASMDFIFKHAGVSSAIIGTINPTHLQHNIEAACRALAGANDSQ